MNTEQGPEQFFLDMLTCVACMWVVTTPKDVRRTLRASCACVPIHARTRTVRPRLEAHRRNVQRTAKDTRRPICEERRSWARKYVG